mgnify:CR=1 FL=1
MSRYDAAVVGSGPNGLAAAITLARAGLKVVLYEAKDTVGGGLRTAELTLPGFKHDICSAIHPFGVGSPFFRDLPLEDFGLEWLYPDVAIAHPLDDEAVLSYTSLDKTAEGLGVDKEAYRFLFGTTVREWPQLEGEVLGPMLHIPKHPLALARFGWRALLPATMLANSLFKTERAKALFAGIAAHAIMPLERLGTAAAGMLLGTAGHVWGWPLPKGGSQSLADAMTRYFQALGGEVFTGAHIQSLDELEADIKLLDLTPQQLLHMTGDRLPGAYKAQLEAYRYGAGVFKLDYALSEPVPWKDPACLQAGTVHIGGTLAEIATSEKAMEKGQIPEKPYVLVAQQSLFDATRAPDGKHTLWAYCHVPNGSSVDMTERIEAQLERFAPGFKETVLARHAMTTSAFQAHNPNYIGGDINGGAASLWQLIARPVLSATPYKTPLKGVYLCSSSTPPGGGVHGMCGYHAAKLALEERL